MLAYKRGLGSRFGTGYAGGRFLRSTPVKRILIFLIAIGLAIPAMASSSAAEEAAPKTLYYALVPAMVGNYGSGERLKYYKADVALRIANKEAEDKVKHHEPLIRNQLVMLFSQQT